MRDDDDVDDFFACFACVFVNINSVHQTYVICLFYLDADIIFLIDLIISESIALFVVSTLPHVAP